MNHGHGTRDERGAELIEFALVLPLVLILLMGIFDFGLAFQRYEVITNAAREGARLASLAANYSDADIQARVDAYCDAANLPNGGCPGATVNRNVAINVGTGTPQMGISVTVTYTHNFGFLGPILGLINGSLSSVNLTAVSTMRSESGAVPSS